MHNLCKVWRERLSDVDLQTDWVHFSIEKQVNERWTNVFADSGRWRCVSVQDHKCETGWCWLKLGNEDAFWKGKGWGKDHNWGDKTDRCGIFWSKRINLVWKWAKKLRYEQILIVPVIQDHIGVLKDKLWNNKQRDLQVRSCGQKSVPVWR